jgi:hypothetical protein
MSHWSWKYFYTNRQKYLNNDSFYQVWCNACVNGRVGVLRQVDEDAVRSGIISEVRTEEELITAGKYYSRNFLEIVIYARFASEGS